MKLPKKYRPLLAALAALAVVAAAYFLIVNLTPEEVEEEEEKTSTYVKITEYGVSGLDHVDFEFDDGYTYTLRLTHKSESSRSYSIDGKAQFDFDYSSMSSAALSLATMSATRCVSEDESDLAQYGLDAPQAKVTVCGTDGTSVTVYLGAASTVGNFVYMRMEGSNDVYMMSSYTSKYLLARDTDYRELDILSLDSDSPVSTLSAFTLTNHDEEVFSYRVFSDEEIEEYPDYNTTLVMTYPKQNQLNETTLSTYLLEPIESISATGVIEDFPKDLSKYGLDSDTLVLEWTLAEDGSKGKLTLSQPTEDGIRYGYVAGIDSVLSFKASTFEYLETFDYTTVIYRLLWSYNIQELAGFDVTAHGVTYEVRLYDPSKEEEEADENNVFWATIDGETLREENARRLYMRVLSPSLYSLTDEDFVPEGDPEWSAVIYFDTGRESESIAFYQINARQYAAYRNGEPTGYYVSLRDLQDIDEALEIIAEGDLIPS